MARFTARVDVQAPARRVWDLLVDWPNHGRWVPLTRVDVLTLSRTGVGARFNGRTGLGPLAFDDPMEVVEWSEPDPPGAGGRPGRCAVVKHGRLVLGRAWFTVEPTPRGCRVEWSEDVELAPVRLTRPLAPVLDPVLAAGGRWGFTRMLRSMAREAERAG